VVSDVTWISLLAITSYDILIALINWSAGFTQGIGDTV